MENAWIIPLVIYVTILAYWKHIFAAILVIALVVWAWRMLRRR